MSAGPLSQQAIDAIEDRLPDFVDGLTGADDAQLLHVDELEAS